MQGTSIIIALPKINVIVVTVVGVVSVVVTIINVCVVAVVAVVVGVAASIINLVTSVTPETEKHYGTRCENVFSKRHHYKTTARRLILYPSPIKPQRKCYFCSGGQEGPG